MCSTAARMLLWIQTVDRGISILLVLAALPLHGIHSRGASGVPRAESTWTRGHGERAGEPGSARTWRTSSRRAARCAASPRCKRYPRYPHAALPERPRREPKGWSVARTLLSAPTAPSTTSCLSRHPHDLPGCQRDTQEARRPASIGARADAYVVGASRDLILRCRRSSG